MTPLYRADGTTMKRRRTIVYTGRCGAKDCTAKGAHRHPCCLKCGTPRFRNPACGECAKRMLHLETDVRLARIRREAV